MGPLNTGCVVFMGIYICTVVITVVVVYDTSHFAGVFLHFETNLKSISTNIQSATVFSFHAANNSVINKINKNMETLLMWRDIVYFSLFKSP